jgi:IS5 family transposase
MYKQLVMWKLKDEANGKTKEQNAIEMKKRLDSLPSVVKEIRQYAVSINIGKAHKRYEFGCKAGIVTTARDPFIVGALAFEGNPYDGHSLTASLEQTLRLLGKMRLDDVYVDMGYQGHHCAPLAQVRAVRRRWRRLSRSVRRWYRRRSSIEPIIGHQKQDHRLRRNHLKGVEGDKMNVILMSNATRAREVF